MVEKRKPTSKKKYLLLNMNNLQKYLNSLKRRDLATNTIKNYKYVIKKYLQKTKSLTTPKLKSYIQTSLKNLAPTTCQENLNILTLYAKYCQVKIKKEAINRIIPKFQQRFFSTITFEELELLKKVRFERNEKI